MNILKKIFGSFSSGNKNNIVLATFLDPIDSRDVVMSDPLLQKLFEVSVIPKEYTINQLYSLPVKDQKQNGSCVGQAEGEIVQLFETIEGKDVEVSRRDLYSSCKKEDGLEGQGTFPRVASSIMQNKGVSDTKLVPDLNHLSHNDFISVVDTEEIIKSRALRKIKAYVSVPATSDYLIRALLAFGAVCVTLPVDWSVGWTYGTDGKIGRPKVLAGYHRVILSGYNKVSNDVIFYFKNSWSDKWGTVGFGGFSFNELEGLIYDARAYVDLPDNALEEIKKDNQYVFTQLLKYGSRGYEVRQLQKYLKISVDGVFGHDTRGAVFRFQKENGLYPDGIVGAKTRAILNKQETDEEKKENGLVKITDMAKAIQEFEGWFPGSRSFRNNNPGNLRWSPFMTGTDSGNFAIFSSFDDGWKALVHQITIAKTGKSNYYKPTMSLKDFFTVYAPSSDNNHPERYATFVAQKLKVGIDYKIGDLV